MEYIDIVDKNRKPINKTLQRGSLLFENEFFQGAEIWIINSKNQLLIDKRSINKSHPNLWECPGGCTIAGETTFQTIKREVLEEVGINLEKKTPTLLGTKTYKNQFIDIYTIRLNDLHIKDLILQKEEVQDAKFVSQTELQNMINTKEIVESVSKRYYYIRNQLNSFIKNKGASQS